MEISKNLQKLYIVIFLILTPFHVLAQTQQEEELIEKQDRTIQNQQQFERDQERKKEIKRVEDEAAEINKKSQSKEIVKPKQPDCFQINNIIFTKNRILSKKDEKFLTKDHVGKCLTAGQIDGLLKNINNHMASLGYMSSKASLKGKKSANDIEIIIIEGSMDDLLFNKDELSDKTKKLSDINIPKKKDSPKISPHQIDRLHFKNAVVKTSQQVTTNQIATKPEESKNLIKTRFMLDDLGSEDTGKTRDTFGIETNNLLHLNETFNISRTANDFDQKKEIGRNNSLNAGFSIPYKNHIISLSYSNYSYLFRSDEATVVSDGFTISKSVNLETTWFKNNKYKLVSNIGLSNRQAKNYIDEILQTSNSRKSTNFIFSLPNTFYLKNGNIYIKPIYVKGLKILDARKDDPAAPSFSNHAQFNIFRLFSYYSTNFKIPKTEIPANYVINFDAQLADKRLYSNERLYIGGPFTVRGFEDGSIGGDSGYNIRNELKFNIGKTLAEFTDFSKFPASAKWLHNFTVSPFYDYGYIRGKGGFASGRLSGAGIKTSFNYKKVTANLTYAWVTSKSRLLDQQYGENQALYFDITTELGFF